MPTNRSSRDRGPAGEPAEAIAERLGRDGVAGEEGVEAELGAERPGLGQPGEAVGVVVDLEQSVDQDELEDAVELLLLEHVDDDRQGDPVGGEDPEEPSSGERPERRARPTGQVGQHERPVEQEP